MLTAAELKAAILADDALCARLGFDTLSDILYLDGRMVSDSGRARALGFERIPIRAIKINPDTPNIETRVPIYRKYLGMVGTVSLIPEEKVHEQPLIRLVPKPGQEPKEGAA